MSISLRATRQVVPAPFAVLKISATDWRVSCDSLDEFEPSLLLGYVERLGRGRYEVLWVGHPMGWAYVTRFDEAIAALVDRERFDGEIELQRDKGSRETSRKRSFPLSVWTITELLRGISRRGFRNLRTH